MQCPIDKVDLVITERQGIEIDYCPKCRGVWLDRGELDKLIERAATGFGSPSFSSIPAYPSPEPNPAYLLSPPQSGYRYDDDDDDRYRYENQPYGRPSGSYRKRRKGFLDDLFDFY